MKLRKLHQAKRFSLTFLLMLTVCMAVLEVIFPVYALTTIEVVPSTIVANPGEFFTVSINITGVTDLWTFGIHLSFEANILEAFDIFEGDFLKQPPSGGYPPEWPTYFVSDVDQVNGRIAVINTRMPITYPPIPNEGADGSGTLFTVKFQVEAAGTSSLRLYDTQLLDTAQAEIPHSTSDEGAFFHTTVPVASFSFTPDTYGRPIVGENITFDASDSYDPDGGGILSYTWDFNDTTPLVTTDHLKTYHIYNESTTPNNPYIVTLTITDDDGESNNVSREVHVKFHDIAIVDITAPEEIFWHGVATINVTVLNKGTHSDTYNVTAYYNSNPITEITPEPIQPATNETHTFNWYTYVATQTSSFSTIPAENWIGPLNANASNNLYTSSDINNTYQDFTGYKFYPNGWTGVSKVEVGIEAHTDPGGDDQLNITVSPYGSIWSESYVIDVTSTTDTIFWVDVTGNLSWSPSLLNNTKVRIQYLQVGDTNTTIYVDWLPVRISPLNPIDLPPGTYAIWANAFLVEPISLDHPTREFRVGEEENMTDNTLFGDPIVITLIPMHDVAVTNVEVTPTEVAFGRTSTVKVEIENRGNIEETFDVIVEANSTEVGKETEVKLLAGATKRLTFTWYKTTDTTVEGTYNITVYIPQPESQTSSFSTIPAENWIGPLNANASNNLYTSSDINNTYQDFTGYKFYPRGWVSAFKVEVGIEAHTDPGGDDQLNITVYTGKDWTESYIYDVTSTTDTIFWVDVTGDLSWLPSLLNNTKVRIQYLQVGDTNTTIYVDWLPVRVTPLTPTKSVTETMRLLPRAIFTFSPSEPLIGDEVTFDASASYAPGDPGGDITDYIWDFGDGTNAAGQPIVPHTYNNPDTYKVKLTVVDNEELNSTATMSVTVPKWNSIITLSASPVTVPISLNTTISGSLSRQTGEMVANASVVINYTRIDDINYTGIDEIGLYTELDDSRSYIRNWTILETVSTNDNGEYSLVWSQQNDTWPQQSGTYKLKAFWEGDSITDPTSLTMLDVNVIIQDIAIVDVVLSKIKLTTGENLTIDVTTTNRGTTTETFNVTVYYNDTLLETKTLTNLTAGSSETLSFNWNTTGIEEGVYIVKTEAEPLLGETYVTDNSRTSGVFIQELPPPPEGTPLNIFLYTTIGLAIAIAVMAAFLVRMMKSKPK